MEWVVTTGKTVEEAKERALDQLGVHESDAEFEILEEPKAGLFGRLKGEARVRARVRPAPVRQKVDRRDRRRSEKSADSRGPRQQKPKTPRPAAATAEDGTGEPPKSGQQPRQQRQQGARRQGQQSSSQQSAPRENAGTSPAEEHIMDAHQVGEEAKRFLEGLVGAFGLDGTVELVEDGDELELRVHGQELGLLVGPRGTTLQAVQDVVRVASQRRLGDHETRLRVDVGGYRERRKVALGQFAAKMAEEVKASGVARVLEPMSSADRKIVHDTLSEFDGIVTRSEGEDPQRRVIIAPAND